MTSPELVAQLARRAFGPGELKRIGRGDLAGAIRGITIGGLDAELRYQVNGQHLDYAQRAGGEGRVHLRTLAEWAASRITPAKLAELDRCYREYVRAVTTRYTLNRTDPDYQADPEGMWARANAATAASRALDKAARACLADEPDTSRVVDGGLFPEPPRQKRRLAGAGAR